MDRTNLIPIPNGFGFSVLSARPLKSLLLLSTLLMATGAAAFSLTDNALTALNPAGILSLGKLNPALFVKMLDQSSVSVVVETRSNQYSSVVADISRLGGELSFTYKHVTGLAASLPGTALFELAQNPEVVSIDQDADVTLSSGFQGVEDSRDSEFLAGSAFPLNEQFTLLDQSMEAIGASEPNTYINVATHGALPVIASNIRGQDSIAAIIDTGIYSNHFMIRRAKVVGGVDLSADVGTGFEGFDDVRNHWHGSAVAGVMGGFARILISDSSLLAQSIQLHTGSLLPDGPVAGTKILTLSGIAPATKFFVIKVFPHTGAGAPTSTIVAGIDAAIDAKSSGQFDIDIISMSLGGPTLFDGRGIDAQAIHNAIQAGIAVSIAAGNEGPAPMTVADPGASHEAITSAAAAHRINTRVAWDLQFGILGIGSDLFTSNSSQIHAFSSRGPTADGRAKPDVSSIGIFTLSAFPCATAACGTPNRGQGLAFVSGTSFSTPATSGVLSLLNDYVERVLGMPDGATPEDLKQAVIAGAVPFPGYSVEEQGAGFVNAANSLAALNPATFGTSAGPLAPIPQGTPLVSTADIRNLFLADSPTDPVRTFTANITLSPGRNMAFVFDTTVGNSIQVSFTNVNVGANPNPVAQANFPNSFEVYIHDSKRGGSGDGFGYYIYSANVLGDATFNVGEASTSFTGAVSVFPEDVVSSTIEPGFSKVVIEGDWTNAVSVSAVVTIEVDFTQPPNPNLTLAGTVGQFDFTTGAGLVVLGPFNMNLGTILKLSWSPGDYAHFPTSDVDMLIAKGPNTATITNGQGATLNSPERAVLGNSGSFFVLIIGFEINPPGATENWTLDIFL